jgi:hypothetical protein
LRVSVSVYSVHLLALSRLGGLFLIASNWRWEMPHEFRVFLHFLGTLYC